jgi:hypothetical protein
VVVGVEVVEGAVLLGELVIGVERGEVAGAVLGAGVPPEGTDVPLTREWT